MSKSKFLTAYDERGDYLCDYMVVELGKGKSAVLPVTKRMKTFHRKLLSPWMKGERKGVFRGFRADKVKLLLEGDLGRTQEAAYYRVMKPLIENGRRRDKIRVLKRIGAIKKPKTC